MDQNKRTFFGAQHYLLWKILVNLTNSDRSAAVAAGYDQRLTASPLIYIHGVNQAV